MNEQEEFEQLVKIAVDDGEIQQYSWDYLFHEQKIINQNQFYIVMMSCPRKLGGINKNERVSSNLHVHRNPMILWFQSVKKKKVWMEPVAIIGPFKGATKNPIEQLNRARRIISRIKGVMSKTVKLIPFVEQEGVSFIPCQPTIVRREDYQRLYTDLRKMYPEASLFSEDT